MAFNSGLIEILEKHIYSVSGSGQPAPALATVPSNWVLAPVWPLKHLPQGHPSAAWCSVTLGLGPHWENQNAWAPSAPS